MITATYNVLTGKYDSVYSPSSEEFRAVGEALAASYKKLVEEMDLSMFAGVVRFEKEKKGMTCTVTKKREIVENVIMRPSDVYTTPGAKQRIEKLLASGVHVTAFRLCKPGDYVIDNVGNRMGPLGHYDTHMWDAPRFITGPPSRQKIEDIWE